MAKTVRTNIDPLKALARELHDAPRSGPVDAMFKQWGTRYLAFTRRRFVAFSGGGGDWPDLAPSTKKARRGPTSRKKVRRRKGAATTTRGSGRKFAILRDTGTLLAALDVGAPGNRFDRLPDGIEVGFGGPSRHPKGKATIADIARFHNQGAGKLPQRKIIVPPDSPTVEGMRQDGVRAVQALGAKHGK